MNVTNRFFYLIAIILLRDESKIETAKEALAFYEWLYKLRRPVFLPAKRQIEIDWRLRQIQKVIKKMPRLSPDFFNTLRDIHNTFPEDLHQRDKKLIIEKRERVEALTTFLNTLDAAKVDTLRSLLNDQPRTIKSSLRART